MKKIGRRAILHLANYTEVTRELHEDPAGHDLASERARQAPEVSVDRWLAIRPAGEIRLIVNDSFPDLWMRDMVAYVAKGPWLARYIGRRNRSVGT